MKLFLKGFIIGIAKIIPGVSGAMLAVSFNVYDKLIHAITNFFDNKKENLKFLFVIGMGVLLAIVSFSHIIKYFIENYYLITMMLFIGLIVGGTYNFSKRVTFNLRNSMITMIVLLLVMGISLVKINNNYAIGGESSNYFIFFTGGVIEIFSSIVPGISGTALFMLMGIYDEILLLFSKVFDFSFVIDHLLLYISYGLGMAVSFIVFSLLISYLLKKYRWLFDTVVLGLSIASILLLMIMAFKESFHFIDFIIGILLFFVGVVISYLFDRE